jgi:hypothetical protein
MIIKGVIIQSVLIKTIQSVLIRHTIGWNAVVYGSLGGLHHVVLGSTFQRAHLSDYLSGAFQPVL